MPLKHKLLNLVFKLFGLKQKYLSDEEKRMLAKKMFHREYTKVNWL